MCLFRVLSTVYPTLKSTTPGTVHIFFGISIKSWHFSACVRYCTRRPDASTVTLPVCLFLSSVCRSVPLCWAKGVTAAWARKTKKGIRPSLPSRAGWPRQTRPPLKTGKLFFLLSAKFEGSSMQHIYYIKTSRTFIHSYLLWSHSTVDLQCYVFKWRKKAPDTLANELGLNFLNLHFRRVKSKRRNEQAATKSKEVHTAA